MSKDFIQWLLAEVNEGNWVREDLAEALCQLTSDNKLRLAAVDEELQKQLATLNKTKTCLSVPMLGSRMQQWIYQEAKEGRWDRNEVFRVLKEVDAEGETVITATAPLGMCC